MGDSACLMHAFSYASAIPNEAKQGNRMHALGESISFGRFTNESLAWEKWSTFSHKRYVEEAERYAQPGSVAQKKAFFEAHYKRIAAQKAAAALLEQSNTTPSSNTTKQDHDAEITPNTLTEENAAPALKCPLIPVAPEKELTNGIVRENKETISGSELSQTSHTDKPLLKVKSSSSKQDDDDITCVTSKKRSAFSSFKSSVHSIKTKFPSSPARHNIPPHVNKENNFTPFTNNQTSALTNEKRSSSNSLSKLMNFTPAKEPDKVPPPPPITLKKESSRVAPNAVKKCATPLKTTVATSDGATKRPMTTPSSENRSMTTSIHPTASGSQTAGPKWNILSAVLRGALEQRKSCLPLTFRFEQWRQPLMLALSCPKSFTACRNKLQSPSLSTPFLLRTEERAARRKQKLEEKFNAKEVQKVQLQTTIKEKAEMEIRKLRQSFCFRARPLPKFYKERKTAKNCTKKTPVKRSQSPKRGTKPSNSTMVSQPPTYWTKKRSYKNSGKKNSSKPINSQTLPTVVSHDQNASPNIQHQFGVSPN